MRSIRQLELVCLLHIPPVLINLCLVGLSCGWQSCRTSSYALFCFCKSGAKSWNLSYPTGASYHSTTSSGPRCKISTWNISLLQRDVGPHHVCSTTNYTQILWVFHCSASYCYLSKRFHWQTSDNSAVLHISKCRVMNGINAPKVIECMGSDGHKYRQLAKSGNDDLRQDAVCSMSFLSSVQNLLHQFLTFMYCILVG